VASYDYDSIVTIFDRPTLVLAGPGAGKTFLLGDRVKRLLEAGVNPDAITVLTFARDASLHMQTKLLDTKGGFGIPYKSLPNISTMHSLGFGIINKKPKFAGLRKSDLRVQEDEGVKELLYRDAALILGHSEADGDLARRCKQLGNCERGSTVPGCSICEKYWSIMAKCNCIDFDDQVLFACQILEGNGDILAEYWDKCQHLLVDEYQDINAAQFRLIKLLNVLHPKGLFVVGDDAQSIYGFRGADPQYILRFDQDFPGAVTPPLAHSRRCHHNIMKDAELVLKEYYPAWTGPYTLEYHVPAGDEPIIWRVPTNQAEAEWTARIARQAIAEKKTVLILVPKREFCAAISRALTRYAVPHECPANLLPAAVNRRLHILYRLLEWVKDPHNSFQTRLAIESLINNGVAKVPGAIKGKKCKPETIARRIEIETEIAGLWEGVSKKRDLFNTLMEASTPSKPLQLIRETLEDLLESYGSAKGDLAGEFSKRISLASGGWADPTKLAEDVTCIMEHVDASRPTSFGAVQLMTMRRAKGLEADVVVMVGLEDDIIPNPATATVEEEARLFYVSMTRAKEHLYMIHSYLRPRNISYGPEVTGKVRSRFLDAIGRPSKYMKDRAKTS